VREQWLSESLLYSWAIIGFAKAAGHWNGDVSDDVYRQLILRANEVDHP
jgi:hypothetical protein